MPLTILKKNKKSTLFGIRTFKSDLSETMKKGEVSLTSAFLNQDKQRSAQNSRVNQAHTIKKILLIVSGVILIVTLVGVSVFFFFRDSKNTPTQDQIIKPPKPLVFSQSEVILEATSETNLKNQLEQIIEKEYLLGDLVYFPIKKDNQYLNSKKFLNLLNTVSPTFLTTFLEDDFFLGILSADTNHPVLIFEIKEEQYDSAFAGMLRWEKQILNDLSFMFIRNVANITTTPVFVDKIIKNQSARIAEIAKQIGDEEGSILLYSVFDRKYIIIADDQEVLSEIIRQFVLYS